VFSRDDDSVDKTVLIKLENHSTVNIIKEKRNLGLVDNINYLLSKSDAD
jgi:glycosyltransferase involved in cell wall biosynthesis